jgi:hypothetical protein
MREKKARVYRNDTRDGMITLRLGVLRQDQNGVASSKMFRFV